MTIIGTNSFDGRKNATMENRKKSKISFLILSICLSLCIFDMFENVNWTVTARDEHAPHDDWKTTDRDTYISERVNGSNHGHDEYLKIGNAISGHNITYLHFAFPSYDTSNSIRADLYIYVTSVFQETLLDVYVAISNVWGEYTINWTNALTYGNIIAQKSVSSPGFVIFDVSSASIISSLPEITFIIATESFRSIRLRSKENSDTRMEDEFPHIIFIRKIVPGFDVFITIFLLSIVITFVGTKLRINKKLKIIG